MESPELITYVNGKRHQLPKGRAETTLLQYLRGKLLLAGNCTAAVLVS